MECSIRVSPGKYLVGRSTISYLSYIKFSLHIKDLCATGHGGYVLRWFIFLLALGLSLNGLSFTISFLIILSEPKLVFG